MYFPLRPCAVAFIGIVIGLSFQSYPAAAAGRSHSSHSSRGRRGLSKPKKSRKHNGSARQAAAARKPHNILHINVGGRLFVTTRATLKAEKDGVLADLAANTDSYARIPSPTLDTDDVVFIDRDPNSFEYILSYLRNGCRVELNVPGHAIKPLRAEAEYFGLKGLKTFCDEELVRMKAATIKKRRVVDGPTHLPNILSSGWEVDTIIPATATREAQFVISREEQEVSKDTANPGAFLFGIVMMVLGSFVMSILLN